MLQHESFTSQFTARLVRTIGNKIAPRGKGHGRLCILNYHRVLNVNDPLLESEPSIATFRWQMKILAECFNVLPLHDAAQALVSESMPPRAVCITFDDGYHSVHDLALPILKEFRLPATVFISSGYIDRVNMWNDRIMKAIETLPLKQLDLQEFALGRHSLDSVQDRRIAAHKLVEAVKYRTPNARNELASRLESLLDRSVGSSLMLTRDMVTNLVQAGIEIGGHTVSHPILSSLDDESAYDEIANDKTQLEKIVQSPIRLFAYPNGKMGVDFDERHMRMAKDVGFSAAFTTSYGPATGQHDRYLLPRSRPWDATPARFAFRLLYWLAGRY